MLQNVETAFVAISLGSNPKMTGLPIFINILFRICYITYSACKMAALAIETIRPHKLKFQFLILLTTYYGVGGGLLFYLLLTG